MAIKETFDKKHTAAFVSIKHFEKKNNSSQSIKVICKMRSVFMAPNMNLKSVTVSNSSHFL